MPSEVLHYIVNSLAWVVVGFSAGFGCCFAWLTRHKSEEENSRRWYMRAGKLLSLIWVDVLIVALGITSTLFVIKTTKCQARFNSEFVHAVNDRSKVADSDRDTLVKLVQDVADAKTPLDSRRALARYLKAVQADQDARARTPLPELKNSCL